MRVKGSKKIGFTREKMGDIKIVKREREVEVQSYCKMEMCKQLEQAKEREDNQEEEERDKEKEV